MLEMVVLVRHGDAELFGPEGTDLSRRLTPAGVEALEGAYPETFALLRGRGDVSLWASPAVRATSTAEVVASALGLPTEKIELHECLYDQDDEAFLAELFAEGDGCVVAVGHIPFMQRVLFELTGVDLPFGKGCAAAVRVNASRSQGTLEWFVQGPR